MYSSGQSSRQLTDIDDLKAVERTKVVKVLQRVQGNKIRAARTLVIERQKIYRVIAKYNISDADCEQ